MQNLVALVKIEVGESYRHISSRVFADVINILFEFYSIFCEFLTFSHITSIRLVLIHLA